MSVPDLTGQAGRGALNDRNFFARNPTRTWLLAFLSVLIANLVWALMSDVPPAWDMAYHQLKGHAILDWWRQGPDLSTLSVASPNYPPLYYFVEASILALAPGTGLLPFWSNLPGLFLLSCSSWGIARRYLDASVACWAGILPLLFPMSAWIGREALIDGLLAGWTALAGYLLLRSDWFRETRWTIAFGLACGAGVLTKWTFPVYLAVPVLIALAASESRVRSVANLTLSASLSIPLVLPYYLPNLSSLASRYPTTNQVGIIPWKPYPRHGEPGLDNLLGWIYYPRVVIGYFLFAAIAALFAIGVARLLQRQVSAPKEGSPARNRNRFWNRTLLWGWLVGGIVLLTFVTPKDPRFALPLVAPLAVLVLLVWEDRPRLQALIVALACLQFLMVSFWPLGSLKLALFDRPGDHDYQNLQREWVLFETHYFDVTGPPIREDWRLQDLLRVLPEGASVAFLPDLVHFHAGALQLLAVKAKHPLQVFKIGDTAEWPRLLGQAEYVVGKSGAQGISFITQYNSAVVSELESEPWTVRGEWPLPDGSQAVVWQRH